MALNKPHNNLGRISNWLVHQLISCWINRKLHFRGYTEEGKITPAYPIQVQDKYSININIMSSRKE